MKKANRHDAKLFGGFGIFPFSLVMFLAFMPTMMITLILCACAYQELPKFHFAHELRYAQRDDAISVGISHDGKIYFDSQQVTENELITGLRKKVANGSEPRVYMNVDVNGSYAAFKAVLADIGSAGLQHVSFIASDSKVENR